MIGTTLNRYIESSEILSLIILQLIKDYLSKNDTKEYIGALPLLIKKFNENGEKDKTPFEILRTKPAKSFQSFDKVVHKSIKQNADNMIKKVLKSQIKILPDLVVGDKFRVEMEATKGVRKMSDIMIESKRKKRQLINYTKRVYEIIEVINKDGF